MKKSPSAILLSLTEAQQDAQQWSSGFWPGVGENVTWPPHSSPPRHITHISALKSQGQGHSCLRSSKHGRKSLSTQGHLSGHVRLSSHHFPCKPWPRKRPTSAVPRARLCPPLRPAVAPCSGPGLLTASPGVGGGAMGMNLGVGGPDTNSDSNHVTPGARVPPA